MGLGFLFGIEFPGIVWVVGQVFIATWDRFGISQTH